MYDEFITLNSDTTFKYLFKTEKGRIWFEDLILHTTGIDISEYELYDNELNSGNTIKDYRLDLLLKSKKDYIVIEMNNENKEQSLKARYYLYRITGKKFNKGESYEQTKNTLIMFNNYKNEVIKDLRLANYTLTDKKNNLELEDINIYEIYLPNYHNICYDKLDKTGKKLYLFNCKDYKEMEGLSLDKEDKYIVSELRRLSMDDEFRDEYDAEKVNKMMMQTEYNAGLTDGIKQEKIEIAKSLLTTDMSIDEISKHTNLSIQEIQAIEKSRIDKEV